MLLENQSKRNFFLKASFVAGALTYLILLTFYHYADNDLWARLAHGAYIWDHKALLSKDIFAFTPTFPKYLDHEWGSNLVFFGALKALGQKGLMFLKILTAFLCLAFAILCARKNNASWPSILLVAIPSMITIVPGFLNVVRCQIFTFLLFSVVYYSLEMMWRKGRVVYSAVIFISMVLWSNLHGGFAAGLGMIGVYTFFALVLRRNIKLMLITAILAAVGSCINPYGIKLWPYIIQILTHPYPGNTDWIKPKLLAVDLFIGFRILLPITILSLVIGFKKVDWKENLPKLSMFFITMYLAIHQYRHGPLFGIIALGMIPLYFEPISRWISNTLFKKRLDGMLAIFISYAAILLTIAQLFLPYSSLTTYAPQGLYPVREVDILMHAKASGNAATPGYWGSYVSWRLYPNVKVSMDGRNETIYPQSTDQMDWVFFAKSGPEWDKLLKDYSVDYIFLDFKNTHIKSDDLKERDYVEIWTNGYSALYAKSNLAPDLIKVAENLPDRTIEPLDASITNHWW